MTQSGDTVFLVTAAAEKLESGLFVPRIAIVQQAGRSYRTISFDMEDKPFPTEAEAIDHAMESVTEGLKKQFGKADIRFNLKKSKDK